VEGATAYLSHPTLYSLHVAPEISREGTQVTMLLDEHALLILTKFGGDVSVVEAVRVSESCWTLYVTHLDGTTTIWRAHLSLDGRWTLSPAY
jgi:hypothetical protein